MLFQPGLTKFFSRKDETWFDRITICVDAFNNGNKLQIIALCAVAGPSVPWYEELLCGPLSASSSLTALLIHVPDILPRDIKFLEHLLEKIKVVVDSCAIETPSLLWVQS